jgi:hypothetical protein
MILIDENTLCTRTHALTKSKKGQHSKTKNHRTYLHTSVCPEEEVITSSFIGACMACIALKHLVLVGRPTVIQAAQERDMSQHKYE